MYPNATIPGIGRLRGQRPGLRRSKVGLLVKESLWFMIVTRLPLSSSPSRSERHGR